LRPAAVEGCSREAGYLVEKEIPIWGIRFPFDIAVVVLWSDFAGASLEDMIGESGSLRLLSETRMRIRVPISISMIILSSHLVTPVADGAKVRYRAEHKLDLRTGLLTTSR
jgi:hypothetical protein